ncbi:conserved hypothetical protein [Verticillium alfalfae VaMs.102]|uniref:Uncharacterized protein n=1 Tax=Verticillium alfalfae (strain VaMs.102 / ATCC MYA-4576 / FGSC 10136) TaxID=526221 RepID=C9SAU3_VERA1|nr:conserved hypothetical protein [Verticillium alfalfae VaMs.102]EEY15517.1 conserved hypothetical protein [Verticillium alfalfae VaMs.102]
MLEYISYKKYKKYKTDKDAKDAVAAEHEHEHQNQSSSRPSASRTNSRSQLAQEPGPILDKDDEAFFASILNSDEYDGPAPPLPPRTASTSDMNWDSSDESTIRGIQNAKAAPAALPTKEKEKEKKSHNPISFLLHRKDKDKDKQLAVVEPKKVDPSEEARERDDLSRVLDDLNLGAQNNKAFALSAESNELVRKFTLVLKDLVNGVPTAVDDLKALVDDRDGTLKKNYDKLPSSMKKLVAGLPDKVTKQMGPEMMAAAAESQGIKRDPKADSADMKSAAKSLLMPKSLNDLVSKPGAIIGMLKAIVNFLKLRWPAFIGLNVVWSVPFSTSANLQSVPPSRALVLPQGAGRGGSALSARTPERNGPPPSTVPPASRSCPTTPCCRPPCRVPRPTAAPAAAATTATARATATAAGRATRAAAGSRGAGACRR